MAPASVVVIIIALAFAIQALGFAHFCRLRSDLSLTVWHRIASCFVVAITLTFIAGLAAIHMRSVMQIQNNMLNENKR